VATVKVSGQPTVYDLLVYLEPGCGSARDGGNAIPDNQGAR
jgi:hypothetical protein